MDDGSGNTLLQMDPDGAGATYGWRTLLVLDNTDPTTVLQDNFFPIFNPNEGQVGVNIGVGTGATTGDDSISGTSFNDTIDGGPGNDTINGGAGDDSLIGDTGNDSIYGGTGNDTIDGGAGNDTLDGGTGNDCLEGASGSGDDCLTGDAGDDTLIAGAGGGNDTLIGGDGNDSIDASGSVGNSSLEGDAGNDTLIGSAGNDTFNDNQGNNVFVGNGGNDVFEHVSSGTGTDIFTGGASSGPPVAHSDTYQLEWTSGSTAAEITDFTVGAGGDVIDVSYLVTHVLSGLPGGSDPFVEGYLRLVADSGNPSATDLQVSTDGSGATWATVLILDGHAPSDFTSSYNFGGYSPTGAGENVTLPSGTDTVAGTFDDDTITANDDGDTVYGGAGGDLITGGTGNDYLDGQAGNDTLIGGGGNDTLVGEGGDDSLVATDPNNLLLGGAGNDTLIGGSGNDTFDDYQGNNSFDGGGGNNLFQNVAYGGADTFADTGDTHQDTYQLNWYQGSGAIAEIADFQGGVGGDVVDLTELLGQLSGYQTGENPFTAGYLRLYWDQTAGDPTYLQVSVDASGYELDECRPVRLPRPGRLHLRQFHADLRAG